MIVCDKHFRILWENVSGVSLDHWRLLIIFTGGVRCKVENYENGIIPRQNYVSKTTVSHGFLHNHILHKRLFFSP